MRLLSILVLTTAACGSKSESPPTAGSSSKPDGSAAKPTDSGKLGGKPTQGSGSGSAAPQPATASGACFDADHNNSLSLLAAGAKTATICIAKADGDDKKKVETCLALDFASGAFESTTRPPPEKVEPAVATVREKAGAYEICRDRGCVKLALPKAKAGPDGGEPEKWIVNARGDGAFVVAAGGGSGAFHIFDGTTGKKKKSVKFKEGDYSCLDGASYLGETIYITGNVCAGPGGGGFLFDGDGKKLGQVQNVNVYGATPLSIDGTVYAFSDFGGAKVALVDVKTGKEVKVIDAPRPENCDTCDVLGDASTWSTSSVAKRPDGKLVAIGGHIAILDPASGKVDKTYPFSVCKPKP